MKDKLINIIHNIPTKLLEGILIGLSASLVIILGTLLVLMAITQGQWLMLLFFVAYSVLIGTIILMNIKEHLDSTEG